MTFSKDFIWGAATASYQIEGAAFEDGKGLSVWDRFSHTPGKVFMGHTGDVACDHYHLMEQDLDMIKSLGIKNYRFSISWPRILPEGVGKRNEKGIDFYNKLIDGLLNRGIRPMMTLFHWDYPLELHKRGSWENSDSPHWFLEFASLCAKQFGDRVKDFIPLNEPACFIGMGHASGEHAPGLKLPLPASIAMGHHALKSNGLALAMLRQSVPGVHLGYAPNANPVMPFTNTPEDIQAARKAYFRVSDNPASWYWSASWWSDPVMLGHYPQDGLKLYERYLPKGWEKDMPLIHQKLDYYGQNIYHGQYVKAADNSLGYEVVPHPRGIGQTASGWPITPECLYWGPRFLYERYKTPILITENGLANQDTPSLDGKVYDPGRENYVNRHLLALKKAQADGTEIAGYLYWSLMDNFEWAQGYAHRFGMVYVDYESLQRIPKESAWWYKRVMETNGENL
ncbi:MAG: beta-glucosidase [Clostridiales bacterium]|nr:beta-glucosidase [Clostridiales bacterium]